MTRRQTGDAALPRVIHSPDPVDVAVGAKIKLRRKQLGMSQSELAAALGITFQQVQKYERGLNRVSASRLARMAAALEMPIAAFFGDQSDGDGRDNLFDALGTPGASEMLEAYARLNGETRQAVLAVARTMAVESAR